jgi:UDPglucose 6-dehydrogenase
MVDKIEGGLGGVAGKTVAVLGLAFKPNTDDTREAPSLTIIRGLMKRGAKVRASDPVVRPANLPCDIALEFHDNEYDTIAGSDALVLVTEWNQYRNLDLGRVKALLKAPVFFDLRNVYKRRDLEERGFAYFAVGQ